jgi:hypothetical protein
VAATLVALTAVHVAAQSLGDVARAEEERRKAVKETGKVYTNDRLRPEPAPSQPASMPGASTAAASPAPARPAEAQGTKDASKAPDAKTADGKDDKKGEAPGAKDEAAWRGRIKTARETIDRSKLMVDALQSRINGLNADFTARDDPAQRSIIQQDLQRALAELDRTKKEIDAQTKALAQIQDEGRRAGVPAGWLR